jgi:ABC-type branched-subunit amino acid transport system substrate-binding protein
VRPQSLRVQEETMGSTVRLRRSAVVAASLTASLLVFGPVVFNPALAEDGVAPDAIVFGQAAVFEGPAAALGTGMRAGITAAFEEANKNGGVRGRKLKLVGVDDGYEPDKSITAVKKLIEEEKVFALIGPVGTPTANAAQPVAQAAKVPYIGPFTGAGFLRDPKRDNVVNIRASYGAETEAWVKHMTEDLGIKKIAIFYQDDTFGRAGLDGIKAALAKRGMELAAEATFERNTVAVKSALLALKRAEPEAVAMVGPYKPCAEFIKLARKVDFNPVFINISFVGASAFAKELGPDGKGVIVSQVVPFPWDASLKVVADYQAAIKAVDAKAEPEFVSLEGYLVGRLAIAALDKAGDQPTREGLLRAIKETGKFDIGGLPMTFSAEKNEGLDRVFMTIIEADGTFKPIEKMIRISSN